MSNLNPIKILEAGKATTRTKLNVRSQPNTQAKVITIITKNIQLAYDGFTNEGENISGNSKWYFTNEGNWFWSGGIEKSDVIINNKNINTDIYDFNIDPAKTLIDYNYLIPIIPKVWKNTQGAGIKIAILDTGFYLEHPDLKNRIKAENIYNAVNRSQDVSGNEEHGTSIAGLIGAKSNNSKNGIIGLAPSSIMGLVKIYDKKDVIQPANLIEGLRWSIDIFKANIVNMSFNPSLDNDSIDYLKQKIKDANLNNIILVVAAGDESDLLKKHQKYAAILTTLNQDNIISVGAISKGFLNKYKEDDLNDYVEFMLPYVGLYSSSNNTSKYISTPPGCSLSTAIISGLISLISSYKSKKILVNEIKTTIKGVAKQYSSIYPTWGKNAFDIMYRN